VRFLRTRGRLLLVMGLAVALGAGLPAAARADGGHDHASGCDENHEKVVELRNKVREVLSGPYKNLASVLAAGYIPYFDAVVPYGNPKPYPGNIDTGLPYVGSHHPDPQTWVKHYVQPWWMDDGDNLNPLRPESILLDEWDRPIGVMFITDLDTAGDPVYVEEAEDGTETVCAPWHKHVDDAAVYAFWGYRYFFKGNSERPSETPPMMHVWADNPKGTFAHEYPDAKDRKGPPPPTPWECTPPMREGPAGAICSD
jgi:hypothetical protein